MAEYLQVIGSRNLVEVIERDATRGGGLTYRYVWGLANLIGKVGSSTPDQFHAPDAALMESYLRAVGGGEFEVSAEAAVSVPGAMEVPMAFLNGPDPTFEWAAEPGFDLRDVGFSPEQFAEFGNGTAPVEPASVVGPLIAGGTLALAGRLLMALIGRAGRITQLHWSRLPGWARGVLTQAGIGVGAVVAFRGDIPFVTLPGQDGVGGLPAVPGHMDIEGVHLGAHVIGSWVANGVTFYRLADGKLAVQNKQGRWKVWRPKKPIVIMPGGAVNLKTLIRADKVLTRQAKQLANILNRRAPRARKSGGNQQKTMILAQKGAQVIDV